MASQFLSKEHLQSLAVDPSPQLTFHDTNWGVVQAEYGRNKKQLKITRIIIFSSPMATIIGKSLESIFPGKVEEFGNFLTQSKIEYYENIVTLRLILEIPFDGTNSNDLIRFLQYLMNMFVKKA